MALPAFPKVFFVIHAKAGIQVYKAGWTAFAGMSIIG